MITTLSHHGGSAATASTAVVAVPGVLAHTGLDIVTAAMRLIGVLDPIESPEPEEAISGLRALNEFLEWLSIQRQALFYTERSQHPLSTGVGDYTIGPGGLWNTPRPNWIDYWSVIPIRTAEIELPRRIPLTLIEWQRIPVKTTRGPYPTDLWFDHRWVAGVAQIHVYPVPNANTGDIVLYHAVPLSLWPTLTTSYSFPPGYAMAIKYGFAQLLSNSYPGSLTPEVKAQAKVALATIKRANFRPREADLDPAISGRGGGGYDAYTDGRR